MMTRPLTWCLTFLFSLSLGLTALGLITPKAAWSGPLDDRLSNFPDWHSKPPVESATGDLFYPSWFAGTWEVTSTLVDLAAPLAPRLVSPGFDSNQQLLHQPIDFQVRFLEQVPTVPLPAQPLVQVQPKHSSLAPIASNKINIIADRAFNGLNLGRAYLGKDTILAVKVDPNDPTRQITILTQNRQLTSVITGRAVESSNPDHFITTEVFQQVFRGVSQPYFNEVENTTAYRHLAVTTDKTGAVTKQPEIIADQVTAVYLSPQDPRYFEAGNHPISLYRYHLEFFRKHEKNE